MNLKRMLISVAGLAFVGGMALVASPAHAVPAAKAIADVVPPGCHTGWNYPFSTYIISTGVTVDTDAARTSGNLDWSTSGASVGLNNALLVINNSKTYRIQTHRWENGTTIDGGPGGDVSSSSPLNWDPTPDLWLTHVNYSTYYEIAGYDINRPAVGFHEYVFDCG